MSTVTLSRNERQEIVIGDELIVIRIERADRGRASISVDAPVGLSVHRREVYEDIKSGKPRKERHNGHARRD